MKPAIETTPDSLELAKDAIDYVLRRIQKDENIRYHMGAFTEAFEKLKAAHCAINGISEEALEAEIFGYELKRKPFAKQIDEIKTIVDEYSQHPGDTEKGAIGKIATLFGW